MREKVEFYIEDGLVNIGVEYEDYKSICLILTCLSKSPLISELIKGKCRVEDRDNITNVMAVLGYSKPVIKPSEFR